MERQIILLILIVAALFLVLDKVTGNKHYIDRFVAKLFNKETTFTKDFGGSEFDANGKRIIRPAK